MKGGEHATAPRARLAEDVTFILAQAAKGVPVTAIARMVGRNSADVATVVKTGPLVAVARIKAPPPMPEPAIVVPIAAKTRVRTKPEPAIRRRKVRRTRFRALTPIARAAVRTVADYYGITVEEIVGTRGGRALQPIRQEAYHAVYDIRMPDGSRRYSSICVGLFFGGRDHTTILSGVAAHMARLAEAQQVAA